MKVKFNDSGHFIKLDAYVLYSDKVKLVAKNLEWNFNGFKLFENDEKTLVRDCSEYKYKWNIHTEYANGVMLTESETEREHKPNSGAELPQEIADPLTNEELTECVADLMYETSLMQLGLEV